ncbi:unnamed protein product [Paramecium primaurelia]|uniref:Uncharacterized protein n=1 Tax=Paramecium primaurelia TaxID=5886 RepID=A0A8S1MR35_PARPR|nr:unnamed protein product [Paramecium primaurelia]
MGNSLLQAFRNLKMRSQIISLDIIILLIVLSIAGTAIYIEIKIFYYISERSLQNTLVNQDIKQISLTTHLMKHYIKEKHQISILLVDHISSFLYHQTKIQDQVKFANSIDLCLLNDDNIKNIYLKHTQKMCYSIYGKIELEEAMQKSTQILSLYNGLKLLENFGLELNKFYPDFLQFVDVTNISFNSFYPFGLHVPNYDLQNRPWYIDHIRKAKENPNQFYFFTDVYKMIVGDYNYYFSITQSLFDENKNISGIVKVMLTVDDMNLDHVKSNILLINKYGQVIYNQMEILQINNSQVFYINNETITGFNDSDWKIIEDNALSNSKKSLSQHDDFSNCIILYNKYFKSYVQLRSEKFTKENFTLITYTNITSKKILEQQFKEAFIESEIWILSAVFQIVLLGALSFSISICFINIICRPLIEINRSISNHVLSVGNNINQMIFKILQQQKKRSSNIFSNLNDQIWSLYETLQIKQQKKCEQCMLIEKMFYHRRDNNLHINPIKIAIKNIPENIDQDYEEFYQLLQQMIQQFKVQEI